MGEVSAGETSRESFLGESFLVRGFPWLPGKMPGITGESWKSSGLMRFWVQRMLGRYRILDPGMHKVPLDFQDFGNFQSVFFSICISLCASIGVLTKDSLCRFE